MAFTTPGTAVAGEVLTAAFWNEQVRDNTVYLKTEADAVGLVRVFTDTFTTESTIQINDCFSATYENYVLVLNTVGSTTAQSVNIQWSVGGTPNNTASSYVDQRFDMNATTLGGARTTQNQTQIGRAVNTLRSYGVSQISGPFIARPTVHWSSCGGGDNIGQTYFGTHNQSTSYDGLKIAPGSGTITGTVAVYGYRL
jgi:hypothetical protein